MPASHRCPRTPRSRAGGALAALALALAGCAAFDPQAGPGPEPEANYADLTTPFVAIGDTQEHLSTGYPVHDNDSAIDAYIEVTQRPPELPLFGRRTMEWALQRFPDEPYIHLGDVMDLSCRTEADRMTKIFRATGRSGAILPGNHDGLMFGIYGYNILEAVADTEAARWNKACRRGAAMDDTRHKTGREAFSKRDFINLYLAEYAKMPAQAPGLQAAPDTGRHRVSWRNPNSDAFVTAIEANLLDGYQYTDSFLVQRLKLPRARGAERNVIVIALDTNQAGALASTWDVLMGRSPGSQGHIRVDQFEAIEPWVNEAVKQGDIVVFAGHHNWQSLGLPTRALLRRSMARLEHPLVYLSAHTHGGFWAVHRTLSRRPLLELNVSSLSDWPIAYRRVSFAYDAKAQRLLVRGDLMPRGDKPNASFDDLMSAWEAETCQRSAWPIEQIKEDDAEIVRKQRDSRGTLIEWLMTAAAPVCERCEQPLYAHANSYQDGLLQTLLQADAVVRASGLELPALTLPVWCGARAFADCARSLLDEQPKDYPGHVALFRRKAELVASANDYLDEITDPRAKAYMTCRAVQAAKIDFDATDDARKEHRLEVHRRAEQFFRIEASVGME
jgi:hypothetical protein